MFSLLSEFNAIVAINEAIHGMNQKPVRFLLAAIWCPLEVLNVSCNTFETPNYLVENREEHLFRDKSPVDLGFDLSPFTHEEVWERVVDLDILKVSVV